jgi:EAL domain-containing protein (putative c-di-GMP-specific phosphodiesterase class I)
MQVIAEAVETEEQYGFLKGERCDAMLGFLFGTPVAITERGILARLTAQAGHSYTQLTSRDIN